MSTVTRDLERSLHADTIARALHAATSNGVRGWTELTSLERDHFRRASYLLIRRENDATRAFARFKAAEVLQRRLRLLSADAAEIARDLLAVYEQRLSDGPLPFIDTPDTDAAYARGIATEPRRPDLHLIAANPDPRD